MSGEDEQGKAPHSPPTESTDRWAHVLERWPDAPFGRYPNNTPRAKQRRDARSDATWYSMRSDQNSGFIPECAIPDCLKPSYGGEIVQSLEGQTGGHASFMFRFFCKEHTKEPFPPIYSSGLFGWKITGHWERGVYTMFKLTSEEQEARALRRAKKRSS